MAEAPPTEAQPRQPKKLFWRLARIPLVTYLAICVLLICFESKLIYPAPAARSTPTAEDFGFEAVHFQSADGTGLHGWYYAHPDARFGLLYCHGNGEDITHNADLVRRYRNKLSASVFIFDYRGYGQSAGSPHEAGIIADGLAAQRWLAERMQVEPDELIIVGRSLGGGVAVALAEQLGARALILQNTFASMTEVAASKSPWLPIRWMIRNRYPSAERIQAYTGPLLQCHGTADGIVPFEIGKRLFAAAPSQQKRFIEFPGAGHNGPLPSSYYQALVGFVSSLPE